MARSAAAGGYFIQKCERSGAGINREAADRAIDLVGIRSRLDQFCDRVKVAVSRISNHEGWIHDLRRNPQWGQATRPLVKAVPVDSLAIACRIGPNVCKVARPVLRGTG